ncbi:hypothetical protein GCM10023189_54240 [Nibrella saemangeumensis]|uniref:Uncharacterized protein n=2 Tax=Nibrella saemangeumensis TaxID=1084526 RepID=A0ABP8NNZ4_9BACT
MLEWLVRYNAEPSFGKKVALLFEQHAEHVLVTGRIMTLMVAAFTEPFSISLFTVAHTLTLLVIPVVFWRLFKREQIATYHVAVPVVLLFSLHYYQAVFMMGCFNHTFLFGLSVAIIYLLAYHQDNKSILLAMGLSLILLFANSGAATLLLVGIGALLLKRDWKSLVKWGFFTILALGIFFTVYQKPAWTPDFTLDKLLADRWVYVKGFFGLIGGVFSFLENPNARFYVGSESFGFPFFYSPLAFTAGVVICIVTGAYLGHSVLTYFRKGRLAQSDVFLTALIVFLFGLTLSATLFRLNGPPSLLGLFVSRYKLQSILLLICCYSILVKYVRSTQFERVAWIGSLLGAIVLSAFSYFEYFVPSQNYNKAHFAAVLTWQAGSDQSQYYPAGVVSEIAYRYWRKITEADVYQAPAIAEQIQQRFLQAKDEATEGIDGWQIQKQADQSIIISNPNLATPDYWGVNGNYIVTWNNRTSSWDWVVASPERASIPQLLLSGRWLKPGVKLLLANSWLESKNLQECFLVTVQYDSVNVNRIQIV